MSDQEQSLQTHLQNLPERKSTWRFIYLKALGAEGTEATTRAVQAAEAAMLQRWQELEGTSGSVEERTQLKEAAEKLLKVKTERLGWPNPGV